MPIAPLVLDDEAWFAALTAPETLVVPNLTGHARGRMRPGPGWDTGERALDAHLVYGFRRGRSVAILDGKRLELAAGTCCLVPPGRRFRFQVRGKEQVSIGRLRLHVERDGRCLSWGDTGRVVPMGAELRILLDLLVDELHVDGPRSVALRRELAHAFCLAFARAAPASAGQRLAPDQVVSLHILLEGHPCGLTPRDMARHLGLGLDWFTRVFRATTGRSPRAWIVSERIRIASRMLVEGSESAEAVAGQLGYHDPKLFGRQFRQVMGCPPGEWRRRERG